MMPKNNICCLTSFLLLKASLVASAILVPSAARAVQNPFLPGADFTGTPQVSVNPDLSDLGTGKARSCSKNAL